MIVDAGVGSQESLGVAGRLEPSQLPLSSPRWLVRHLDALVQVLALPVLHLRQDVAPGGTVALELVGHNYSLRTLEASQEPAERSLGGAGVAPVLQRFSSTCPSWSIARQR